MTMAENDSELALRLATAAGARLLEIQQHSALAKRWAMPATQHPTSALSMPSAWPGQMMLFYARKKRMITPAYLPRAFGLSIRWMAHENLASGAAIGRCMLRLPSMARQP